MNDAAILLARPLRAGRLSLRNRLVFGACVTNYAVANKPTQRLIDHYVARARGGVGAIVSEGIVVEEASLAQATTLRGFGDDAYEGFARFGAAIAREGVPLYGQIMHLGRHHIVPAGHVAIAPTDEPDAHSWVVPHALDADGIQRMIDAFVATARLLDRAGFTGVDLHGAQGFLLSQFLSPSNRRADGWGGERTARTRFVREIIAGVRAACSPGFVIGLKIAAEEGVGPRGIDHAEAIALTAELAPILDWISYSQGSPGATFDQHVPDMTFPRAPFVDLLASLKAAAGATPVMGQGRLMDAAAAAGLVSSGAADLAGFVRPLLADPAWPNKVLSGREAETIPCIHCNACWAQLPKNQPLLCVTNPAVGTAADGAPTRAAARRARVEIVGGGIAGLAAAAYAAEAGLEVQLREASGGFGGVAAWQASLPGRAEVAKALAHFEARARAAGARLVANAPVGSRDLAAAEHVVLATGAEPRLPHTLADFPDAVDIVTASGDAGLHGDHLVLFDQTQSEAAAAAVEALAMRFRRVTLLSPRPAIATETPLVNAVGILRRFAGLGVEWFGFAVPTRAPDGRLAWRHLLSGRVTAFEGATTLVHATPRHARAPIFSGPNVVIIGDAVAPRSLAAATIDARRAVDFLLSRIEGASR